ncbi:unnamed protein product [Parascedosporium putredinis]|uniref:Uncharacterized protein n=1 Tax=Parascedosporium putredinis TaxID=1442378 RepID=A0A9P1M868_9PEZI|nr:unnamed protein product [Parascedosporium putredinis]CAI7989340.1 unnamed protein product [Parascedosporium putredinis]
MEPFTRPATTGATFSSEAPAGGACCANNAERPWRERFAHGALDWGLENRLTARELSMLRLMNDITDKEGWERESTTTNDKAWEWCLTELRDKARAFARTGRVRVLDAGACICKGKAGLKSDVYRRLDSAVRVLIAREGPFKSSGSDAGSKGPSVKIVDPSLYPLVYGRTGVLPEDKKLDLDDIWKHVSGGVRSQVLPHELDSLLPRRPGESVD